jgi:hypothetical protein
MLEYGRPRVAKHVTQQIRRASHSNQEQCSDDLPLQYYLLRKMLRSVFGRHFLTHILLINTILLLLPL